MPQQQNNSGVQKVVGSKPMTERHTLIIYLFLTSKNHYFKLYTLKSMLGAKDSNLF